jgi:hypothetical protein
MDNGRRDTEKRRKRVSKRRMPAAEVRACIVWCALTNSSVNSFVSHTDLSASCMFQSPMDAILQAQREDE